MKAYLRCINASLVALAISTVAFAGTKATTSDLLVKLSEAPEIQSFRLMATLPLGSQIEDLKVDNWVRVQIPQSALRSFNRLELKRNPSVVYVQPNYPVRLLDNPGVLAAKVQIAKLLKEYGMGSAKAENPADNPAIPPATDNGSGADPLLGQQWGMTDSGAKSVWDKNKGNRNIVVAVIDTGVDYTHEDLRGNIWRNPGESGNDKQGRAKESNGVDDDGNGYVDDLIGWDFVSNDNKPYDLSVSMFELLTGGNPGHGTHCAGNVAAKGFNGKGISGVAPNVSIMPVRFLSEKGQGTTADAIKAVRYAVENGAHITSNSWGSEGEEPGDPENEALKDAIRFSEQKGSLFVAAAGNGHQGVGYDNDSDANPGYPASYDMDVILSVAALDEKEQLGSFSNWGRKSVDVGAPGVKVFSTTVGNKYSDKVIDFAGMTITWDGTSMATPHVAGAAALYWSQKPNANWRDVKNAILKTTTAVASMNGKSVSNGKLNVPAMLNY